jgi:putative intracellular protease/amidase
MRKIAHFLAFDGYGDWEVALLLAELRRTGGYEVVTLGFSATAPLSMGGLRVEVDSPISEIRARDVELLIVPGGDGWQQGAYPRDEVHGLIASAAESGAVIGAICGATIPAARAGLLDDRAHTSNFAGLLAEHGGSYRGEHLYRDELAVRDGNVVTASGIGYVEFAREILAAVGVFEPDMLARWFETYKHGRFVMPPS